MGLFGKKFKPNIQELYTRGDVDGLIEAYERGNADIRDKAGDALYELIPRLQELELLGELAKVVNMDISVLRREAAIAIGHIAVEVNILRLRGREEAVESLIKALEDKDEYTRSSATLALGRIKNKRAVEPLIKRLREDPDGHMRWMAADALGEIKDKRAVEPLIDALDDRPEEWGAGMIAPSILEEMGDKRAVEPLQRRLKQEKNKVRRSEIKAALRKLQK